MDSQRTLKRLGDGWTADGDNFRRDFGKAGFLVVMRVEKEWVAVSHWADGGRTAQAFTSLKQLLAALAQ